MFGNQKTKAVCLMLLSALLFSIMQVFVKWSSAWVGTFEQTFFRNLVSLVIAAGMVRRERRDMVQEVKNGGWALWGRSLFGFLGVLLFFYAAGNARQADVAMLNRASPVFVTLFAAIFLKERITVEDLAEVLGVSASYLSRLFKKETGDSVSIYIRRQKIEMAKHLLQYSEFSMIEIANRLSFSSQSHFIQQFREIVGMTPKKYRDLNHAIQWDIEMGEAGNGAEGK